MQYPSVYISAKFVYNPGSASIDSDFSSYGLGSTNLDSFDKKDSGNGFWLCNIVYIIDKGIRVLWHNSWASGHMLIMDIMGSGDGSYVVGFSVQYAAGSLVKYSYDPGSGSGLWKCNMELPY
ncbi:hypothetical protein Tco_0773957 [Tanacetum coccineum]|uniref:Uncharacterized protein n=1 Tax=Tanacetum coccineum TaxID=301880 RepID=A0ABQ4ZPS1_9ASTR